MPQNNNLFNFPRIEDNKELKEIYISVAIRAFATSIVSIFVPLFLMEIGYSFNQALWFLIVYFGAQFFIAPLSGHLSTKIGIKHVIFFGPVTTIIYLILLFSLANFQIPIYLVALVGSLGLGLFWIPVNSHFAKHSHKDHSGIETSYLIVGARTVSVVGPLIGGFLIASLGFTLAFVFASVVMVGVIFPLFMSYEYKSKFKYKFSQMFVKKNVPYLGDFVFQGIIKIVAVVIFPIYIFMISQSYGITGAVATLAGAGIAVSALVIGRYSDKKGKIRMMRTGGVLNLLLWLFLMLVKSPLLIYISSFFVGFFAYAVSIPLFAFFCDKLGKHEHTQFMVFREIGLTVGRVALLFLLLFFAIETKFTVAFALSAVASLYFIFADLG